MFSKFLGAALALLLLVSSAQAQVSLSGVSGAVAPGLSGTGAPAATWNCNAISNAVQYIQTDAAAGSRLWICEDVGGTYAWENLRGPVATAVTAPMTAGVLALGACNTTTVTIQGATVGANAAIASPIGMPTSSAGTAGLANITAYVSAANTITVSVCAIGALTTAAITYKVLMY